MNDNARQAWRWLLLGGLYLAGCAFADAFIRDSGEVTLFWPAAGVAMAATMRYGLRAVVIVPLVLLPFHLLLSPVPVAFLPFSLLANTMGTLAGGWLALRVKREDSLTLRAMLALMRGGVLLALVGAAIGLAGLHVSGMVTRAQWPLAFLRWALGDFVGVVAVAPALLLAMAPRGQDAAPGSPHAQEPERLGWLVLLAASYLLMAWGASFGGQYPLGVTVLPLTLLAWSALRFPPLWTALGSLASILLIGLFAGFGLAGFPAPEDILDSASLLAFLCMLALLPLLLAITVQERRRTTEHLLRRATTDPLSGLPNRQAFEEQVRLQLEIPEPPPRALAYLGLDHLKLINDTASHAAGDTFIQGVAGLLRASLPADDLVAHLGGDEFGMLLQNCSPSVAEDRARTLLRAVASYRCAWHDDVLATTASVGLVPFHATDLDYASLLSQADAACYTAKELGGNRVCMAALHGGETLDRTRAMHWAVRLREAVRKHDLGLYCQTIQPLHAGSAGDATGRHFEILLRVRDPATRELLLPGPFLAAAERFGMSVSIDRAVVGIALDWLEAHPDAGTRIAMCCINLSAEALVDEEFIAFLTDRVNRSPFPGDKLCLEITETSAVRDLARAQRFIGQMRDLGCRFALDDFGTGFCSFSHLHTLDVDYFKIDGSFVKQLRTSTLSVPIVRAINEIAHVLDKRTIAEHTESDELINALARLGVDFAQGYAVHRPEPIDDYFSR
ncbi:MAG: EAL domain-containing protein, partial [Pseudomonadota bacterium]|nr:EAL domain-containing protein [Pseudomonadota bacterium]